MGSCRKWTSEELEYLEDNWDKKSKKALAKHFGRTVEAVKLKANRIGLINILQSSDYISVNELLRILHVNHYGGLYDKLDKLNFPSFSKYPSKTKRIRVIRVDDFLEWSKQHPEVFSFEHVEPFALGVETEWIKQKREADKSRIGRKIWTTADDVLLKNLLSQQRYTCDDLAKKFRCNEGAILRRAYDIGAMDRPISSKERRQV